MTLTPVMRFRIQDEDSVHVLVIPSFDVSVSVFMYCTRVPIGKEQRR